MYVREKEREKQREPEGLEKHVAIVSIADKDDPPELLLRLIDIGCNAYQRNKYNYFRN